MHVNVRNLKDPFVTFLNLLNKLLELLNSVESSMGLLCL